MSSFDSAANRQELAVPSDGNGGNIVAGLVPRTNFNVGALTNRVVQPPCDWVGPEPSTACELFIRRIPRNIDIALLVQPFQRFGQIYEMRIPLDFNLTPRGYAYIKYTTEMAAQCALFVMSHYHILPHRRLEVLHSYEKSRLYVANIPTHLPEQEVFHKLMDTFPNVERVFSRNTGNNPLDVARQLAAQQQRQNDDRRSQGHALVQFPTHRMAIEAKRLKCPTGTLTLFGRDLKVVWANSQPEANMCSTVKTLFVRNVDNAASDYDLMELINKCVPRNVLRKMNRIPNIAFLEFVSRDSAANCLKQMQGCCLRGKRLEVEWARLSQHQTMQQMRKTDFDALLRIKCIANGWQIPIIVFGTYFEEQAIQYAVVILRGPNGFSRAIFCIFQVAELRDIHSRLCEVVCALIDMLVTFPDYNYVFHVEKDMAHLLGVVSHTVDSVNFLGSDGVPQEFALDLQEMFDLSYGVASLVSIAEDYLLHMYNETFLSRNVFTYLPWCTIGGRIFGTIMPRYRNKRSLPFHLNDSQIVLAMCYCGSGTNTATPARPYTPCSAALFDKGNSNVQYMKLTLLGLSICQSSQAVNHLMRFVKFGGVHYYHPAQRFMVPPIWISGYSYARSIYQLTPQGYSMGPRCDNAVAHTTQPPSNGGQQMRQIQPTGSVVSQEAAGGMQMPQNPSTYPMSYACGAWCNGAGGMLQPQVLQYPMNYAYGGQGVVCCDAAGGMQPTMSSTGGFADVASGMQPPQSTPYPVNYACGGLGGGDGMPQALPMPINYYGGNWCDAANGIQPNPMSYAALGVPYDGGASGMQQNPMTYMQGGASGDEGLQQTQDDDNTTTNAQPQ